MTTTTGPVPTSSLLNLPNSLTLSRLLLAAVMCGCIHAQLWLASLLVFILAILTDWLDGFFARKFGTSTAFGRCFDPLVDKVLVCSALVFLLPHPESGLAAWMVALILARELLITGLRGVVEQAGVSFGADYLGKLKMVTQSGYLLAVLLHLTLAVQTPDQTGDVLQTLASILLVATIVATVVSGMQYFLRAAPILANWESVSGDPNA